MAFQRSSVKLEGKLGDLSFYKVDGEYHVKQHIGHSKERIAQDPSFERTRENNTEFGLSSSLAKLLKVSLKQALERSYELFNDPSLTNRLTKRMTQVLKADAVNARGKRTVLAENLNLFTGFSVNNQAALKDVFFIPIEPKWLMEEQLIRILIPSLNPNAVMDFPKEAAKFQFHLCAISINNDVFQSKSMQSSLFATNTKFDEQSLELSISDIDANGTLMLFLGVSFYGVVAGYPVPLIESSQNALDVIKVFLKSS
jgi:hypothetical protein